jgi:hypothetical protein
MEKRRSNDHPTDGGWYHEYEDIDEQELEEQIAEARREYYADLAKERQQLREIAALIPGPETPDPKDKIYNCLIAEYGFPPQTLWHLSHKDMKRYIEARQPAEPTETPYDEWLPASKAVEQAQKAGYKVGLDWITRSAAKYGVRTRGRQLPGNHRLEVEWNSLAGHLLKSGKKEPDEDGQPEEDTERRIQEARERKRQNRPLD